MSLDQDGTGRQDLSLDQKEPGGKTCNKSCPAGDESCPVGDKSCLVGDMSCPVGDMSCPVGDMSCRRVEVLSSGASLVVGCK